MSGARSTKGCHTCRVRKKKCDEQHPVCLSCISRGITCYGYGAKPAWMDGGEREEEMTMGIRKVAERNYRERRKPWNKTKAALGGDSRVETSGKGFEAVDGVEEVPGGQVITWDAAEAAYGRGVDPFSFPGKEVPLLPAIYSPGRQTSQPSGGSSRGFHPPRPSPPTVPMHRLFWDSGLSTSSPKQSVRSSHDLGLLMHYLDVVFPLQFGFYQPLTPGPDNGRGWLLQLALRSHSMYHTCLSLGICHQEQLRLGTSVIETPRALARNHAVSLKGLKESIDTMHAKELEGEELWSVAWEVLACMNQLLSVEVFRDIAGHWELHLAAARTLLSLLPSKINPSIPGLTHEDLLAHILMTTPSPHASFFLTCFLWVDIVAQASGLSSPNPPNLNYHFLLSPHPIDPTGEPLLDLKNMMGCENWAMLILLDISTLAVHKKAALQSSPPSLNPIDLHLRAAAIRLRLENGIVSTLLQQKLLLEDSLEYDRCVVTHLFALAAFTYLAVVVAGPWPSHPAVRASVARTLPVLAVVPKRLVIRVSWPVCVTGCMAVGEAERGLIREAVGLRSVAPPSRTAVVRVKAEGDSEGGVKIGIGEGENSGTVWKGMRVVEECWRVHDLGVGKGCEEKEFGWEEAMEALGLRILLV